MPEMMEVSTIRLPKGMKQQLKTLAHKKSIEQKKDISWSAMVRAVIEKVLLNNYTNERANQ